MRFLGGCFCWHSQREFASSYEVSTGNDEAMFRTRFHFAFARGGEFVLLKVPKKHAFQRAWHSQRESNSQLTLRRGLLYPFNYGSIKFFLIDHVSLSFILKCERYARIFYHNASKMSTDSGRNTCAELWSNLRIYSLFC